ncbi:TrmH family RNA methyltransferase [Aquimarina brevivitae]|uniref:TrmH family RNA methyltransferase n=1 Tax=Aquimarina brevivitae TaxID=323412 RepID=A0A4Q7NXN0_9FLAO|nr:RNA methyltransferase [Aquimarina brevivitae]RZS91987.1 TrmH family RNA methyltransferase [Aquimarina brevivitae]
MVSKNQKKLINSLHQKKYRKQHHLFIAEGIKVINEFIDAGFVLHRLFTTEDHLFSVDNTQCYEVTEAELKQLSQLKTPQKALALFEIPKEKDENYNGLVLALDDVSDPGNLGTIIRLCDWFGVTELICSKQTVDCYNPKVVQATMGSLSRVNIRYLDLKQFLEEQQHSHTIYGTFMDGDPIYTASKSCVKSIIVMGNEANGISPTIEQLVTHKIAIPRFGQLQLTESLNVATATSIVLNEFRRADFTTET